MCLWQIRLLISAPSPLRKNTRGVVLTRDCRFTRMTFEDTAPCCSADYLENHLHVKMWKKCQGFYILVISGMVGCCFSLCGGRDCCMQLIMLGNVESILILRSIPLSGIRELTFSQAVIPVRESYLRLSPFINQKAAWTFQLRLYNPNKIINQTHLTSSSHLYHLSPPVL